jgi:hypothetical protein
MLPATEISIIAIFHYFHSDPFPLSPLSRTITLFEPIITLNILFNDFLSIFYFSSQQLFSWPHS